MNRWFVYWVLIAVFSLALPSRCPAPLIYRPGEGWIYEPVGGGTWQRARAKDQLEVAQQAFDKKEYRLATRAARRVVSRWPYSDYAPKAQLLMARCYEGRHMDERAFNAYQKLLDKYPKDEHYPEILQQQFTIANRFLGGQWFRIFWSRIPFFPSMEKTIKLYEQIVKSGPFSEVGPQAQMSIGKARLKQKDFPKAATAFEKAADRYYEQKKIAAEAMYQAGMAYNKQAQKAEYDQSVAGKAIAAFTDFKALYPEDPRAAEMDKLIGSLRTEQARGSLLVAKFYEKRHHYDGALIYYNEVLQKDRNSPFAAEALQRIEAIQKRQASRQR